MRVRRVRPKIVVSSLSPWNQQTKPKVVSKAPIAPVRGQGLRSTMWNGCWCLKFLFIFMLGSLRDRSLPI